MRLSLRMVVWSGFCSIREIWDCGTLSFSANCFCVRFLALRARAIRSPAICNANSPVSWSYCQILLPLWQNHGSRHERNSLTSRWLRMAWPPGTANAYPYCEGWHG